MKTTTEILDALVKENDAHHEKVKKELAGMEDKMKFAFLVACDQAFREGFIAAVKVCSDQPS